MLEPLGLIARDRTLRLMVLIMFVFGTAVSAISPYQALIGIQIYGLPDWAWSLSMFFSAIITMASAISFGIVTDQLDNRRIGIIACAVLSISGAMLVWIGDNPTVFLITHILIWPAAGAMMGQLLALARLAARRYGARQQVAVVSAVRAMFALAFVSSLPAWSLAFAGGLPLRGIYPIIAVLGVLNLILILIFWTPGTTRDLKDERSGLSFVAALREIMTAGILIRLLLLSAIIAANVLYMQMMGLLFDAAAGRDFSDAALFLTFVTGMEVPFMLATGAWAARWGKVRLIVFGGLFYAVFLVVFVYSIPYPWVWALTVPAAIGAALLLSVPIAYMQELLAHRPGAGGSLPGMTQFLGMAVAAAIFALGTSLGDYVTVAYIAAALASTAAVSLGVIEKRAGHF